MFAAQFIRYLPAGTMRRIRGVIGPRLADWAVQRVARSIPRKLVRVPDGRQFRVGPDPIFFRICGGGEFEPQETAAVRKLVRPGDCVLDVGANIGWYATLCSQLVGPKGLVFAFEPVAESFEYLEEHLRLNHCLENTIAIPAAVGSTTGSVEIHVFHGLSLARASVAANVGSPMRSHIVPRVTIDAFIAEKGVARVDFLKCDVEGCEVDVLGGAMRLLTCDEAPVLLIELNSETGKASGFGPADVWSMLQSCGYRAFFRLGSNAEFIPVKNAEDLALAPNLICMKPGPRMVYAAR